MPFNVRGAKQPLRQRAHGGAKRHASQRPSSPIRAGGVSGKESMNEPETLSAERGADSGAARGSETACKHDTWRHSQTYPPDPRSMTVRRMEWCECGKLMDDREWKIPLPEAESPNEKGQR
jgi:hypothetical protein